MTNLVFVLMLSAALACLSLLGDHDASPGTLADPGDRPGTQEGRRLVDGVNLTWYGLLTGNAYVVSVAVLFILMGAVKVPLAGTALLVTIMLACCVPASRLVARVVEKKAHTFTVGGAVFVGVLIAPGSCLAGQSHPGGGAGLRHLACCGVGGPGHSLCLR